jgi:hypothetical protein
MHKFGTSTKAIYGPRSRSITPLKTADGLTLLKDHIHSMAIPGEVLLKTSGPFHGLC